MSETFEGTVNIEKTGTNQITLKLESHNGNAILGGNGVDGDLILKDGSGNTRVELGADEGNLKIKSATGDVIIELGRNGNLVAGGGGKDGDIILRRSTGSDSVHIDGDEANLWMGANGTDGDIFLFAREATARNESQATVHLNGEEGNLRLGGNGTDGDIALYPTNKSNDDGFSEATIHLDGQAGDITLRNADCAEDFDIANIAQTAAGAVMVIDDEGRMDLCTKAYDRRVAGVISGAGDYQPGLVLDRQASREGRLPIALVGKVFCQVDADLCPIRVGDLLTTSPTAGYAMRAEDPAKAFGAVLGKALRPLAAGKGMVPLLVGLQ